MLFLFHLQGHYGISSLVVVGGVEQVSFQLRERRVFFPGKDRRVFAVTGPNCAPKHLIHHRLMRQDDFTLETKIVG